MRLYDTASRSLRDVALSGRVSLYVCGITPYDSSHLGHAFTYHTFDVLTRRLGALQQTVTSVRNVTDVDDDILRVARERGKPFLVIADDEVARFDADLAALNILPVDVAPRASRHVPAMVEAVARLVRDGVAYDTDGWVYFSVAAFPLYGALSRLDPAAMVELSRERGADPDDPRKRNPLDFVLWQPSREDEPRWPSPWGEGRPGWHIECSVLSADALGTPIDIHGGGDDLIFPHHECEIAQAEAGTGGHAPFARHWAHVAMVGLGGVKMSKSLGNLVFARDLVRNAGAGAVRLLLATHHYRTPWSYEPSELAYARERWDRWNEVARAGLSIAPSDAESVLSRLDARLDDDLDTPGAITAIDNAVAAVASAAAVPGGREGQDSSVPFGPILNRLVGTLGCPPVG